MASTFKTEESREVELSEKSRVLVEQLAADNGTKYLSLNKQWRDKAGEWQFGKGFAVPIENAVDIIMAIASLFDLDIRIEE